MVQAPCLQFWRPLHPQAVHAISGSTSRTSSTAAPSLLRENQGLGARPRPSASAARCVQKARQPRRGARLHPTLSRVRARRRARHRDHPRPGPGPSPRPRPGPRPRPPSPPPRPSRSPPPRPSELAREQAQAQHDLDREAEAPRRHGCSSPTPSATPSAPRVKAENPRTGTLGKPARAHVPESPRSPGRPDRRSRRSGEPDRALSRLHRPGRSEA